MKLKVATSNYKMEKYHSFENFKLRIKKEILSIESENPDLLLFPEYGSIELVSLMEVKIQKDLRLQLDEIQKYKDDYIKFFEEISYQHQLVIVAPSFPFKQDDGIFKNRTYVFFPDGKVDYQEKNMMTRFENEHWKISPGEKIQKVFEFKKIKFGINICYDIEFSDFAKVQCQNSAKLILVPSCTESAKGMNRVHVGARARALENQCYVVVSQTVGAVDYSDAIDNNTGKAAFYSTCDIGFPDNGILKESQINEVGWMLFELDFNLINKVRTAGNVFNFNDIKKL